MLYMVSLMLVALPLLLEYWLLRSWHNSVPIRIHVHGTRGKSGTVKAIFGMLEERGLCVVAKTTGDTPEYILPGGIVVPISRHAPARIQEHTATLRKASAIKAHAVVVEGMALQSETIYQSERILRATHAVIVNVRPDHGETMGSGREGVSCALRHMLPINGEMFTSDEDGSELLRFFSTRLNTTCNVVKAPLTGQSQSLARAVVASVLGDAGSSSQERVSTAAIKACSEFYVDDILLTAYDLLSVNDVVSTKLLLNGCFAKPDCWRVALLATRADRPVRTKEFIDWLAKENNFDALAIMGNHAGYAFFRLIRSGHGLSVLPLWPWLSPDLLCRALARSAKKSGSRSLAIFALGSVHGYGEKWRKAMTLAGKKLGMGVGNAG